MANYVSEYTGAQIDGAIGKANSIPAITENDEDKVLIVNSTGDGLKYSASVVPNFRPCGASVLVKSEDNLGNTVIGWAEILPTGGCGSAGGYLRYSETDSGTVTWSDPLPALHEADLNDVIGYHYEVHNDEGYSSLEWVPGLPTIDSHDGGKFLALNNCQYGSKPEWVDPPAVGVTIPTTSACGDHLPIARNNSVRLEEPADYISSTLEVAWGVIEHSNKFLAVVPCGYDEETERWRNYNLVWTDVFLPNAPATGNTTPYVYATYNTGGKANWQAGHYVPEPGGLNKVLVVAGSCGVYYPEWEDGYPVPEGSSNELNKVLTITSTYDIETDETYYYPIWTNPSTLNFLPQYTVSDIGKKLTIISDGNNGAMLAWS